jgi:Zinc binding domain
MSDASTMQSGDGQLACPGCGSPLREVGTKTVKHIIRDELARGLRAGRFLYCSTPTCDTTYLRISSTGTGAFEEVFHRSDLKERVRPFAVGRDRLVCHCFGYTAGEIEDDAREGRDLIPAAIGAEVKAGFCACEVMNPKGG